MILTPVNGQPVGTTFLSTGQTPATAAVAGLAVQRSAPANRFAGNLVHRLGNDWHIEFNVIGDGPFAVLVISDGEASGVVDVNVTVAAPATGNDGIGTPGNIGPVVENNGEMTGDGSGIPAPHLQPAGHRPVNT